LAHECGHVACRHSVDMLFVDAIVALQWFNPVAWLLRQDLRTVHEYEADARVLSQGFNAYQYLSLLVQKAAGDAGYSVANGISMSSIVSKRVIMMTKKQSSKYAWARLLYVVPIVALSLAATAKTVVDYKVVGTPETLKTTPSDEVVINETSPIVEVDSENPLLVEDEMNLIVEDKKTPLVVIDGQISTKKLDEIDAKAIEAISVIPAETATKLWGSKGENGAVMITMKKGDDDEKAFEVVEKMPAFPGGDKALLEFLSKNIKYPVEAQKKGLQGRVVVNFIVEKNGSINHANVIRSVDPLLDAEALRVVQSMPNWTPGMHNGKAVRVKYNIPVLFQLNGPAAKTDGQTAPAPRPADSPTAQPSASSDEILYEDLEQKPEFPGGMKAMMEYLSSNVKYPVEAQKMGEQGRVIVGFIVEKDGTVSNAKVVKSNRYTLVEIEKDGTVVKKLETSEGPVIHELEAEALRVVQSMPKWMPGKLNGKAVRVKYNLPVSFRLQ